MIEETKPLAETKEQTPPLAEGAPQKGFHLKDIKSKVDALPDKARAAIDGEESEGIIAAVQGILKSTIGSLFSACQIISLQQILLSDEGRNAVSSKIYIAAAILGVVEGINLAFGFSLRKLLTIVVIVLAALVADRIMQHGVKPHKQKQQTKNVSDDDIIL